MRMNFPSFNQIHRLASVLPKSAQPYVYRYGRRFNEVVWDRIWKAHYRTVKRCQQAFGYCAITGGTDCDGMRHGSFDYFWTRAAADEWVDHIYEWADGPMSAEVVSGAEGRKLELQYVPDRRDRFAESMNY